MRASARRVGPFGYVLATDISSNILEFAASNARAAGLTNVETRVVDGENLDVEPEAFDAVISRVGLIYFPDRQKALDGMRRVLKPGGRVAAIVYTTAENNKFFSLPVSIIRRRAQLPPPLPGQPGPFSLGTPGVLEEAYRQAGFRDIQTRNVPAPPACRCAVLGYAKPNILVYTLYISVRIVCDECVGDTSREKKGTHPWDLISTTNRRTNSRRRFAPLHA